MLGVWLGIFRSHPVCAALLRPVFVVCAVRRRVVSAGGGRGCGVGDRLLAVGFEQFVPSVVRLAHQGSLRKRVLNRSYSACSSLGEISSFVVSRQAEPVLCDWRRRSSGNHLSHRFGETFPRLASPLGEPGHFRPGFFYSASIFPNAHNQSLFLISD